MQINEENKRVVRTREELIKHDRDIAKVSKENQTLAMEINELDSYSLLIDVANRLAVRLPKEFVTEKTLLVNTTTAFKNAIDVGDTTLIDSNKDALDQLVIDTENELYIWYNETGKKAGLEKFQKEFDEYKLISQQKLDNTTKKYQTAVRIAYDKRAQNKELKKENRALTQQLDSVQTDFEVAAQGWYENEQQLKQTQQQLDEQKSKTKKAGRKVARITAKMIDEKKLTVSQNAELQA